MFKSFTVLSIREISPDIEIRGVPDLFGAVACGVFEGNIIIESCSKSNIDLSELNALGLLMSDFSSLLLVKIFFAISFCSSFDLNIIPPEFGGFNK